LAFYCLTTVISIFWIHQKLFLLESISGDVIVGILSYLEDFFKSEELGEVLDTVEFGLVISLLLISKNLQERDDKFDLLWIRELQKLTFEPPRNETLHSRHPLRIQNSENLRWLCKNYLLLKHWILRLYAMLMA